MRIPKDILNVAFKIGFNYSKESYNEKATVSLPCSVRLKNGKIFEQAELIFLEKLHNESDYTFFQIEDVESISESEYALSLEIRNASLNTVEYLHDRPFFIESKDGNILGFNAFGPINFTYKEEVKGANIVKVIDFDKARAKGFELIKDYNKMSTKIVCGYDNELVERIKTVYNKG